MNLVENIFATVEKYLGVESTAAQIISFVIYLILVMVIFLVARHFLLKIIHKIINRTRTQLDDALVNFKVIHNALSLLPLFILYASAPMFTRFGSFLANLLKVVIAWNIVFIISAFLNALNFIYMQSRRSKNRPIKGYLQIVSIFMYVIVAITTLAILLGKSPWLMLSSLGAMTAVILFIFKDTILSLLASFQITFNDLIRNGDWLDVPQFNANGTVVDVALHSIKIQNWDKTISIIPTHKLLDGSFKNWEAMSNSGGRRIKRSINIDINSIKFVGKQLLEELKQITILQPYLESKLQEISNYNSSKSFSENDMINSRHLTNIGTFRAYIDKYLRNHPLIHKDMTLIVRQLPATDKGLPLEIYAFSTDTAWANYEAIQSDIFDHLYAVISHFQLKIFQSPSGFDFKQLKSEETENSQD